MAREQRIAESTFTAGAALTKNRCCYLSAANTVSPLADDNSPLIGVTIDDYASGAQATLVVAGIAKIEAGATITAGALVEATTGGTIKAADATVGQQYTVGVALEGAASGDMIAVLLQPGSHNTATT